MNRADFRRTITVRIAQAQFIMLRYETEFTPCTGITAVVRQERRHYKRGIVIAPWCGRLNRRSPEDNPLANGSIHDTGWKFSVNGIICKVLATADPLLAPVIYLDVESRFRGIETPYDTPPELPENEALATLKRDTLYFGLAVNEFLSRFCSSRQFVWGADWETVPALFLARNRHLIALTLHNIFDECLAAQASDFGSVFLPFQEHDITGMSRTALQIGLELADVITTVNRGFAYGIRTEQLHQRVMARHLLPYLDRIVGINNAAFTTLSTEHRTLKEMLATDFMSGVGELFRLKAEALSRLPEAIRDKAQGKAIVVAMGRRVSQKQHDLVVESLRTLLKRNPAFPVLAVFSTVHGDKGSPARLERITALAEEFPGNIVSIDGRVEFYGELMAAADYNCMPSLYEPHGGAYEGTVIPLARAVDGLAEQICGLSPKGNAAAVNAVWHAEKESPSGFLFREDLMDEEVIEEDLQELLAVSPSPDNRLFQAMRDALSATLRNAVQIRMNKQDIYAGLVRAALERQEDTSWLVHLGGVFALVEEAGIRRSLSQSLQQRS